MNLHDTSLLALRSINRNRSRSSLTVLGIVIGIAAVILMLSIGQGAQGYILNQVSDLGADLVFIEPSSGDPNSGPPNPYIEQTLKMSDLEKIKQSGFFRSVAPVVMTTTTISREDENVFAQVVGVTPDYLDIFPASFSKGSFIEEGDVDSYARSVVLGSEIATDLFGEQDPIGMTVKIKKVGMKVIGVFNPQGSRFFQNLDKQVAIPVTTAQRDLIGTSTINYLSARAIGDIENAKEEARFILRDAHDIDNPSGDPAKDDFFVSSQSDAVEIVGAVGGVLTILLASIAAISLLVGGIGIMNIMLVSVTERTREIGLRKAVGATRREILQQFLVEAVFLTMFGGIVGVTIGTLVSFVTAKVVGIFVSGWTFVLPPEGILISVLVASVVGIIFGVYPARQAASLDPIAALRYE